MTSARSLIREYAPDANHIKVLRTLIAHIKSVPIEKILLYDDSIFLSESEIAVLKSMFQRHLEGEPLSKITNRRSFWKHDFFVNEHVLDPRPETELIIESVLKIYKTSDNLRFLDLGTGSGCILLSLLYEYTNSVGIGIDKSEDALKVANLNRKLLNIKNADFINADWINFQSSYQFDVIVSNPPYIKTSDIQHLDDNVRKYDPLSALDGGNTGLNCYIEIMQAIHPFTKENATLFFEIGYDQKEDVSNIISSYGFRIKSIEKDLSGIDRVIVAKRH